MSKKKTKGFKTLTTYKVVTKEFRREVAGEVDENKITRNIVAISVDDAYRQVKEVLDDVQRLRGKTSNGIYKFTFEVLSSEKSIEVLEVMNA